MLNILIVKNDNLDYLKDFIKELCSDSGIDSRSINIRDMSEMQGDATSDIIVLSQPASVTAINKALDSFVSGGTLIVNSDEKSILGFKLKKPVRLVTYGFNQKASVSISSVSQLGSMKLQCCIQRALPTFSGSTLEPLEFSVTYAEEPLSAHDILCCAVTAAVCGAGVDKFMYRSKY